MSTDYNQEYLIEARKLYAIYKGLEGATNVVALRGLNLEIKSGEFVAIVGRSGAGKSTLLRILGGLQKPSAGSIKYNGQEITNFTEDQLVPFRRNTIGFIFQEGNLLPQLSGFDNVVRTLRYAEMGYNDAKKRASEILERLGMTSRMHDLPQRLSGGEQQRIAIARALANNPRIILADEPTGNLDYENTEHVMKIFKELHDEIDTSILVVTHNQYVASFADRNVELSDGMMVAQHDAGANLDALAETRSVVISPTGNLSLPPEILGAILQYGELWNFSLEYNKDQPRIVGVPKIKTHCPVCGASIVGKQFLCNKCGAKLK
jgi:ABC-type lipoprotein export system ATPase subunit